MTATELARLVKEMRDAQKKYFKTRDRIWIDESKRLERKVDKAVTGILDRQMGLFDGE